MIEVENLTKRYGRTTAVDGISFRVKKAKSWASSVQRRRQDDHHAGSDLLSPADGGHGARGGFDVFEKPLEVKRRVGYIPETPPLYPDMDVATYLDFVAKIKGVPAKERAARIDDSIGKSRVGDVKRTLIGRLSKGYRSAWAGGGHLAQSRRVDPGRAHSRPGSQADHRDARADQATSGEHTIVLSTHILPRSR